MTKRKTEPSKCVCQFCENSFVVWRKTRFCSASCRSRAWNRRKAPVTAAIDLAPLFASDEARLFDDRYAVTRDGRVFSRAVFGNRKLTEKAWRELRQVASGGRRQYRKVQMGAGSDRVWDVHRAVAHVFHGPCPEGQEVRHLDGNPTNNHAANLAYGTRKQNMSDAILHGTTCRGQRNAQAKLDEVSVRAIRNLYRTDMLTCAAIASVFEVSPEAIHQVVNGSRWGWLDESQRA